MNTTLSRAEAAIYQDFGARLQPREWIAVLTESRRVQPPGVAALLPARQQIVGVWYSDNSAPPALLHASLKSIVEARRQTWRHEVTLLACCWDKPAGMTPEFQFHRYSGERKRSHGTILAQLQETLTCVPMSNVVCFLEHDVIYPEWYFQAVGDAFDHPTAPVVSNLDYIGLSAQGWQPVRERHEPLHQLSMRWEFALKNLERAAEQAKQGSAILEPQGDRSNWVRIPATPGLGLAPAVHVNHTAGRFTSHGEVVYGPAAATRHAHWGDHKNYWPGDTAPIATVASCGTCNQQPVQHASIEAWYDAARTQPSDFHEHVATLKELADPCEVVTEIAMWGKPSLVALCASRAREVHSHSPIDKGEWPALQKLVGDRLRIHTLHPSQEVEPTDLLFCDTYHDAQTVGLQLRANKDRVRKYIVIHTAETFGEKDQDGAPGVLPGVRAFVREHPDWTVIRQDRNNHGLIVLSRRDEDRKTPPGLLRKALNFTKALAIHTATGAKLVDDETHERRVELCLLCPERAHDVCSLCGCSIAAKASWAEQQCPANPPQWLSASVSSPRVPSSV